MVFQPDFFASADLLCTADEHERGDRYGDKAVENNKKDCTPEEREYNPLNQFLNFFLLSVLLPALAWASLIIFSLAYK